MKKLLIVCPHYKDNHVSSFRIDKIEKKFREKNVDVKILTLSDSASYLDDNGVFYIEEKFFRNNLRSLYWPNSIKKYLKDLFCSFDNIYISMPSFQFIKLLKYIPSKSNVFLDYRDQIDLDYFMRKHKYNNNIIDILSFIDMKVSYFYHKKSILKYNNISKIFCVGDIAVECFNNNFKNINVDVINIHNGFSELDATIFNKKINNIDNDNLIKIGLSGSVYDFRCSSTLKAVLLNINHYAENNNITIELLHWGSACDNFIEILSCLSSFNYLPQGRMKREEYLNHISNVDCLLLLCSDDILWEPTTTIFDYILMRKMIIYSGNLNNEACNIMMKSNINYMTVNDQITFSHEQISSNEHITYDDISNYSREVNVEKLYEVISNEFK